ncbi:MAG TPA: fibronectin type III domain-containing protein, partial [Actinoplanes sp.]|nr:fibronectin type III domain-containing protein [Actinoplanes sp.]
MTPPMSPFPPSTPGNLRSTAVTSASVTLAWNASTQGCCAIDHYEISYERLVSNNIEYVHVGKDTTTVRVVGLR